MRIWRSKFISQSRSATPSLWVLPARCVASDVNVCNWTCEGSTISNKWPDIRSGLWTWWLEASPNRPTSWKLLIIVGLMRLSRSHLALYNCDPGRPMVNDLVRLTINQFFVMVIKKLSHLASMYNRSCMRGVNYLWAVCPPLDVKASRSDIDIVDAAYSIRGLVCSTSIYLHCRSCPHTYITLTLGHRRHIDRPSCLPYNCCEPQSDLRSFLFTDRLD